MALPTTCLGYPGHGLSRTLFFSPDHTGDLTIGAGPVSARRGPSASVLRMASRTGARLDCGATLAVSLLMRVIGSQTERYLPTLRGRTHQGNKRSGGHCEGSHYASSGKLSCRPSRPPCALTAVLPRVGDAHSRSRALRRALRGNPQTQKSHAGHSLNTQACSPRPPCALTAEYFRGWGMPRHSRSRSLSLSLSLSI